MTPPASSRWSRFAVPRHARAWLIYLVFLGFEPVFDPGTSGRDWAWAAVMIAVFLPIYGWTTRHLERRPYLWRDRPGAALGVAGIATLGILGSLANGGATVFLVYAATLGGRLRPRRRALIALIAIVLAVVLAGLVSPIPWPYRLTAYVPVLVLVPVLGLTGLYESERLLANARLQMAQDEIERLAAVAERERIARDLHDLLGHTLSTITLKAELAARLAPRDPERAESEMRDVERISRDALGEVRSAVRGYRARGLRGELANAKLALDAAGVQFDYVLPDLPLAPDVETILALALREGVTNVVRHAHARHCRVILERDGAWLQLRVEDDGDGRTSDASPQAGHGLDAMRERVRAFGGHVTVEPSRSARGSGTRLELALPLARAVLGDPSA